MKITKDTLFAWAQKTLNIRVQSHQDFHSGILFVNLFCKLFENIRQQNQDLIDSTLQTVQNDKQPEINFSLLQFLFSAVQFPDKLIQFDQLILNNKKHVINLLMLFNYISLLHAGNQQPLEFEVTIIEQVAVFMQSEQIIKIVQEQQQNIDQLLDEIDDVDISDMQQLVDKSAAIVEQQLKQSQKLSQLEHQVNQQQLQQSTFQQQTINQHTNNKQQNLDKSLQDLEHLYKSNKTPINQLKQQNIQKSSILDKTSNNPTLLQSKVFNNTTNTTLNNDKLVKSKLQTEKAEVLSQQLLNTLLENPNFQQLNIVNNLCTNNNQQFEQLNAILTTLISSVMPNLLQYKDVQLDINNIQSILSQLIEKQQFVDQNQILMLQSQLQSQNQILEQLISNNANIDITQFQNLDKFSVLVVVLMQSINFLKQQNKAGAVSSNYIVSTLQKQFNMMESGQIQQFSQEQINTQVTVLNDYLQQNQYQLSNLKQSEDLKLTLNLLQKNLNINLDVDLLQFLKLDDNLQQQFQQFIQSSNFDQALQLNKDQLQTCVNIFKVQNQLNMSYINSLIGVINNYNQEQQVLKQTNQVALEHFVQIVTQVQKDCFVAISELKKDIPEISQLKAKLLLTEHQKQQLQIQLDQLDDLYSKQVELGAQSQIQLQQQKLQNLTLKSNQDEVFQVLHQCQKLLKDNQLDQNLLLKLNQYLAAHFQSDTQNIKTFENLDQVKQHQIEQQITQLKAHNQQIQNNYDELLEKHHQLVIQYQMLESNYLGLNQFVEKQAQLVE